MALDLPPVHRPRKGNVTAKAKEAAELTIQRIRVVGQSSVLLLGKE